MTYKVSLVMNQGKIPVGFPDRVQRAGGDFFLYDRVKTEEDLLAACHDSDHIMTVVRLYPFTPAVLKGLKKCRFIQTMGVGYEAIDLKVATELGIGIINLRGLTSEELAEHAMALLLGCARWITGLDRRVRGGKQLPAASPEALARMQILKGKTLGIIGFGNAGRALVPMGRGFGMRVLAYDPPVPKRIFAEHGVEQVALDELVTQADYISIHANLTAEAKGLIGIDQFKKMKPTTIITNTARGPIIDEEALYTALEHGMIAGAGLDVTDPDPPTADSRLFEFDNVILTGHQAGNSPESQARMWTTPIEELSRILRGEWPLSLVNVDVKERLTAKWGITFK